MTGATSSTHRGIVSAQLSTKEPSIVAAVRVDDNTEELDTNQQTEVFQDCVEDSSIHIVDPKLLGKIDKLFACGVGKHVSLPQLVVVGGQSTGKSSVLEGLTKLPFPKKSELCTRYATRITFTRSETSAVKVGISPDAGTTATGKTEIIQQPGDYGSSLEPATFAKILKDVESEMNFDVDVAGGKEVRRFSRDVLQIEVSGPAEEHFSIIDIPGIFHAANPSRGDLSTTDDDKKMVDDMVKEYMMNERSVMLIVVPATNDLANEDIFRRVREVDPNGSRTLGVITKPDCASTSEIERNLKVLKGNSYALQYGWCVVKNSDKDSEDLGPLPGRDKDEEEFFTKKPWNQLPKDRVGVQSLKQRLQSILTRQVEIHFPLVEIEIEKKLKTAEENIKRMGVERDTAEKQRQWLLELCDKFRDNTRRAIESNHFASGKWNKNNNLKLSRLMRRRGDAFYEDLLSYGHLYDLNLNASFSAETPKSRPNLSPRVPSHRLLSESQSLNEPREETYDSEREQEYERELGGIVKTIPDLDDRLLSGDEWLDRICETMQGFELGGPGQGQLETAMKEQSKNWKKLARGYICDMILIVHTFINEMLRELCYDDNIRTEIISQLREALHSRYRAALDHVDFLLMVERKGIPMTVNPLYFENLNSPEELQRQPSQAATSASASDESDDEPPPSPPFSTTPNPQSRNGMVPFTSNVANETHPQNRFSGGGRSKLQAKSLKSTKPYHIRNPIAVAQLRDQLRAYYRVARLRFVDNVITQAGMYKLIGGGNGNSGRNDGPLDLFSSAWVGRLSDTQLQKIMAEPHQDQRRRANLSRELARLRAARDVIRGTYDV